LPATLKATKAIIGDPKSSDPTKVWVRIDYVNPGTVPPTPGSVAVLMLLVDVDDPSNIQSAIDTQLGLLGSNAVDWSL